MSGGRPGGVSRVDLDRPGVEEIARRVRRRELAAGAVVEDCLARVAELEAEGPAPPLGAFLNVDGDGARRRAEEIDRRLAAGDDPGPLAGVPVALKDNLSHAGRSLTCASRILAGYIAPYTAPAVARLEAAGAVVVGRTNMDEFAMGSSTETSAWRRTRNPWHGGRVAGGSSGGSAAAVAAGAVPLALGSDTGGSVRQPAAMCGVVGLKPTWGRVSRRGLVAFASSLDQIGPLTRSTRDAALALGVMAGPDDGDATCARRPPEDYLAGIEEGVEGLRLGVARELEEMEGAEMAGDARRVWRRSLRRLEAAGAELVEVSIPALRVAVPLYCVIAAAEASANLARFDGVRYGVRARAPSSLTELYAESRGAGFGAEVKRRVLLGTFVLSAGYHEAYYGRARAVRESLRREVAGALRAADLLALPAAPSAAFPLGEKVGDPVAMARSDVFTVPASLAGVPAVAVPAGLSDEGLPLSLQLLGRPFGEAALLRAARAFEKIREAPSPEP